MIENLDTDLAVKEDNSATDLLNNSVQQVSVSLVHHSNLNLEIVKREEEEPCSGGELNDESSDEIETFRKQIYSQARSINKSCLAKPKEQRLHDSISKVFGVDDPPPGFGHCYPRHYFLEQNLPRPISPLKVWRGFNGNIYFQPIQTSRIESSRGATAATHSNTKNHSCLHCSLNINIPIDSAALADLENQQKLQNNPYSDSIILIEHLKRQESDQSLLNNRIMSFKPDEMVNSSTFMTEATREIIRSLDDRVASGYYKNTDTMSSRVNTAAQRPRILPNLSAVRRHNIPLRGLAFRQAHDRIQQNDSSPSTLEHLNNSRSNLDLVGQPPQTTHMDYVSKSFIKAQSTTVNRSNYRDMMKGLRRGITLNSDLPSQQSDGKKVLNITGNTFKDSKPILERKSQTARAKNAPVIKVNNRSVSRSGETTQRQLSKQKSFNMEISLDGQVAGGVSAPIEPFSPVPSTSRLSGQEAKQNTPEI